MYQEKGGGVLDMWEGVGGECGAQGQVDAEVG